MLPICLGEATKIAGDIVSRPQAVRVHREARRAHRDRRPRRRGGRDAARCRTGSRGAWRPCCAASSGASRRCRRCIRRSSRTGSRSTSSRARAWKSSGRPREIEIFELRLAGIDGGSLQLETLVLQGHLHTGARGGHRPGARHLRARHAAAAHLRRAVRGRAHGDARSRMRARQPPRILAADRGVRASGRRFSLSAEAAQRLRHGQAVDVRDTQACARGGCGCMTQAGAFMRHRRSGGAGAVRPRRLWVEGSAGRIARLVKG